MEENTEKSKKSNKSNKNWWIIILAVGVILLIVFVFWLLVKGDVKTTGEYPDDVKDSSLTCTTTKVEYPFFTYDESSSKEATINMLFKNKELNSISFIYSLKYDNERAVTASEAHNHAAMNISFAKVGLEADALNANYTRTNNEMILTLHATMADLNEDSGKFFLINDIPVDSSISRYARNYKNQGFKCEKDN